MIVKMEFGELSEELAERMQRLEGLAARNTTVRAQFANQIVVELCTLLLQNAKSAAAFAERVQAGIDGL